jgi:hypothetical protein
LVFPSKTCLAKRVSLHKATSPFVSRYFGWIDQIAFILFLAEEAVFYNGHGFMTFVGFIYSEINVSLFLSSVQLYSISSATFLAKSIPYLSLKNPNDISIPALTPDEV